MIYTNFNVLAGANVAVSPFLQPPNGATILNGVNPSYKLGALYKDVGYSRVSTQTQDNKSITGLFDFRQVPGTQRMMTTMNEATDANTQLFAKTPAGAWSEIGAAETAWTDFANINVEMESFIGYCFIVGQGSVDGFLPVGSVTGVTFSTVTNVTNMAQGKYPKRYRDRMYVANCRSGGVNYPFRVYFSSVPAAGAITWTPASDFFEVDYSEEITGIAENWDILVVFTENSAYKYDQSQRKKVWDLGCSNHRTIKTHKQSMFFCNRDGAWESVGGGYPQNISGEMIDFFRAGTPTSFFAELIDEEYIVYVGNVTVDGFAYTNCELIFNIPTRLWRWRENTDQMTIFAKYLNGGVARRYMGDTDGNVWDKAKYTDTTLISADTYVDVNSPGVSIPVNFELAPIILNPTKTQGIRELIAFADRAQGLKLKFRVLDRNARILTPYRDMGELTKYVNPFDVDIEDGVLIQIAGSENSSNPYFSFYGFCLDLTDQSVILK